ncbi:MAG: Glutamine--fructose-6-phosphate aminotransferase [isomerizing] [Gammaproteobacteria bacterium]|nr:Glutamine--fructose-6-phosphate aminotransferase [isomerizing] [Gammaproteobacteria bacterium]
MCGIVGAVADDNVVGVLLEGLQRLEYRGYDSAGVAVIGGDGKFARSRAIGKVSALESALERTSLTGRTGLAHTRWATHGGVTEYNAHPHICQDRVAVVCNGIVENHDALRREQQSMGYQFTSETDTEVVVHQIHYYLDRGDDLLQAVQRTARCLEGAYALGVMSVAEPGRLVATRNGPPLLVGDTGNEAYIASDASALIRVTRQYRALENGDVADLRQGQVAIYDAAGVPVERVLYTSQLSAGAVELGPYRHFMFKEIFEQPLAIADTLEDRISTDALQEESFGARAPEIFDRTEHVQIIACGTSYHAGCVAKYWLESRGVACDVEVASEFRYRRHVVPANSLAVTISQSGETADTLAALEAATALGYRHSLTICNVPESSIVRASDLAFMTHAGPEVGVASTKAFTTQLTALLLLGIGLGRRRGLEPEQESMLVKELRSLPAKIEQALKLDSTIADIAEQFADKQHALFLGRGAHFPIALEGALKLKEISYIHAEAYPAGELKHGPLALVDASMPVVAVAPNDQLLEKLKSNIQEVRARGGKLLVFADHDAGFESGDGIRVIDVAPVDNCIAPIIYTIPLQLLAYHVAVIKGTDVDKPRNLAKSVTVE